MKDRTLFFRTVHQTAMSPNISATARKNRNVKLNTDGSAEKVKCVLIFDFDLFSLYVFNHTIY